MAKVMKDKRIDAMMKSKKIPFDGKRMIFGGFKTMSQRVMMKHEIERGYAG